MTTVVRQVCRPEQKPAMDDRQAVFWEVVAGDMETSRQARRPEQKPEVKTACVLRGDGW